MPRRLRYVDPDTPPSRFSRQFASFSNTRLGRFLSAKIVWKLDPYVLRATGGRFGMGLVLPTALLETRGAKTGEPRRNGVLYFNDGGTVIIVASKQGLPGNPAWFHNLRANPDVVLGGIPMRAEIVTDEDDRRRLWELADRMFAPYADYRREAAKAGREIPIVQLTPREAGG
jgi:deazaflavin-dependent oxidoreductase (nitroreductase family)